MYTLRVRLKTAVLVPFSITIFAALACTIPLLPTKTSESQITETVQPADTAPALDIPGAILTEVAATIRAQIPQEPGASPPSETTNAPQAPTPIITSTPTDTRITRPEFTATPNPTLTQISSTLAHQPSGGTYDTGIQVRGMNIHWCNNQPWAIFRVRNRSSIAFESLSLLYQDLSANKILSGPFISDAPFMSTDKACVSGGLESLASGRTLYLGNTLGSSGLQGHNMQATIILCTGNGLSGTCYQKIVDFVLP